jgi:hypothetical protein
MTDSHPKDPKNNTQLVDDSIPEIYESICNPDADEFFLAIKTDLNQIDRLVCDAVNNLVLNFKYISELTKSHHEMVMAIEKLAVPNESAPILELLKKQMAVADKVEHELETAITSLQFGDLVTQLLAHTSSQIDVLNRVLQRMDRQCDWQGKKNDVEEIQQRISKAVLIAKTLSSQKPVVQQAMQKGDIELF